MRDLPVSSLVRSLPIECRASEDGGLTMAGHFATFNEWTEINSVYEGQFMERVAPGAFADTFTTKARNLKVLYDHGKDPTIGNKPLGSITSLREDDIGAAYEVDLFAETSYVRELIPALRAGALGASFRFSVDDQIVDKNPKASRFNPKAIPERTLTAVDLHEFGPVTFPAYAGATAGLRSQTDWFINDVLTDPAFLVHLTERAGPRVVQQLLASMRTDGRGDETPIARPDGQTTGQAARFRFRARYLTS